MKEVFVVTWFDQYDDKQFQYIDESDSVGVAEFVNNIIDGGAKISDITVYKVAEVRPVKIHF